MARVVLRLGVVHSIRQPLLRKGKETMKPILRREKILNALAIVHHWEKEMGRVDAIDYGLATKAFGLTHEELDILLNALNVKRTELLYQFE